MESNTIMIIPHDAVASRIRNLGAEEPEPISREPSVQSYGRESASSSFGVSSMPPPPPSPRNQTLTSAPATAPLAPLAPLEPLEPLNGVAPIMIVGVASDELPSADSGSGRYPKRRRVFQGAPPGSASSAGSGDELEESEEERHTRLMHLTIPTTPFRARSDRTTALHRAVKALDSEALAAALGAGATAAAAEGPGELEATGFGLVRTPLPWAFPEP